MPGKALAVVLVLATAQAAQAAPPDDLGKAYAACIAMAGDAGDRRRSRRTRALPIRLLDHDYVLFVVAQASLLGGDPAAAVPLFRTLADLGGSRFRCRDIRYR